MKIMASSMKTTLTSITIAIAIAVFFKFVFPPFLSDTFFICVILIAFSFYSTTAAKTTNPNPAAVDSTPQISAKKQHSATSSGGLRFLRRLESGIGGAVYVAEIKPSDQQPAVLFAAKVMDKSTRNREARARTELEILKMLDHPFLPKLHSSIDSTTELCLLTEFCPAGNLNSLRQDQLLNRFSESAVRFYAAEVVVALEYLHMMGIVHRDLKPENILIRRDGHIMLTNFQLSLKCDDVVSTQVTPEPDPKKFKKLGRQHSWLISSCFRPMKRKPKKNKPAKFQFAEFVAEPVDARSMSFVGTYEYMAPEVVSREGHGSAVDWWALGILIYEMFYGAAPFRGSDDSRTMDNIVVRALEFPREPAVPAEAKDLVAQLLMKEPTWRLGSARRLARHLSRVIPSFRGLIGRFLGLLHRRLFLTPL